MISFVIPPPPLPQSSLRQLPGDLALPAELFACAPPPVNVCLRLGASCPPNGACVHFPAAPGISALLPPVTREVEKSSC